MKKIAFKHDMYTISICLIQIDRGDEIFDLIGCNSVLLCTGWVLVYVYKLKEELSDENSCCGSNSTSEMWVQKIK